MHNGYTQAEGVAESRPGARHRLPGRDRLPEARRRHRRLCPLRRDLPAAPGAASASARSRTRRCSSTTSRCTGIRRSGCGCARRPPRRAPSPDRRSARVPRSPSPWRSGRAPPPRPRRAGRGQAAASSTSSGSTPPIVEPAVEAVEDARVDVGGAGDGGRVAEVARHLLDGARLGALACGLRAAAPGPDTASATAASTVPLQVRKSLALNSPPAAVLDVLVDVGATSRRASGRRACRRAARRRRRGGCLSVADDARHLRVADRLDAALAALGLVVEGDRVAVDRHVALAHRREAVGLVLLGVVLASRCGRSRGRAGGRRRRAPARAACPSRARSLATRAAQLAAAPRAKLDHRVELLARRAARASGRGRGTACARRRRCRWPGCGPSGRGRSRRPSRPAGSRARGSARARSAR